MNSKAAREGFVQSSKNLEESRDKVFNSVVSGIIKTAGDEKAEKKQQKEEDKAEKKELKMKDKMTKKEAIECGFFKIAKACGFGIYSIDSLDGGQGSVWYLDKDATTGEEYLMKQVDAAGDVVRRIKSV